MRHFQMSAFNQQENLQGPHINPPPTILGAWYGVKNAMTSLAMDITEQGMSVAVIIRPCSRRAQAATTSRSRSSTSRQAT